MSIELITNSDIATGTFSIGENPLFSILMPVYNRASMIEDAIKSVLQQTYKNWELIIVDDGSDDDSIEVSRRYKDSRIVLAKHHKNLGVGAGFRTAATISTGQIIGLLGSDDALEKNALEIMSEQHTRNPQFSLITSSQLPCDEHLNPTGAAPNFRATTYRPLIFGIENGNFVSFKREAYFCTEGFQQRFLSAVDHDLFLKLEEVGRVGFFDHCLYRYRQHKKSVSQGKMGRKAVFFFNGLTYGAAHERRRNTSLPQLQEKKYHQMMKSSSYQHLRYHGLKSAKAIAPAFQYARHTLALQFFSKAG